MEFLYNKKHSILVSNIKTLPSPPSGSSGPPPAILRRLAEEHLGHLVAVMRRQEQLAAHVAELAAFLLWRHLEYYLLCNAPPPLPTLKDNAKSVRGCDGASSGSARAVGVTQLASPVPSLTPPNARLPIIAHLSPSPF